MNSQSADENDDAVLQSLIDVAVPPAVEARMRSHLACFRRKLQAQREAPRKPWKLILPAAAAAAILLSLALNAWLRKADPAADWSLLSSACASENAAYLTGGLVHIRNEIQAFANPDVPGGATWLPISALRADGTLSANQLTLEPPQQGSLTVSDDSWYDGNSGRFVRLIKAGDAVIFANSFDGSAVYTFMAGAGKPDRQVVAAGFRAPAKPAQYLGLAAGMPTNLKGATGLQSVSEGKLADGADARVYQLGLPDADGKLGAYWLMKVRTADQTLAQKEFYIGDRRLLLARRVFSRSVNQAQVAWDLKDLEIQAAVAPAVAAISPDMVITGVSVADMVRRADFETYVLAGKPAWTDKAVLDDVLDLVSKPRRMFSLYWRADDGRHVVMVQSPSYNAMLGPRILKTQPVYTSPNGFKLYRNADEEKWFTRILLDSSRHVFGDPAADNRMGGLIGTPAGTVIALAVNGPLTDQELHSLIDPLVPAKDVADK